MKNLFQSDINQKQEHAFQIYVQCTFNETILSFHNENFSSSYEKEKETTRNRENWLPDNPT